MLSPFHKIQVVWCILFYQQTYRDFKLHYSTQMHTHSFFCLFNFDNACDSLNISNFSLFFFVICFCLSISLSLQKKTNLCVRFDWLIKFIPPFTYYYTHEQWEEKFYRKKIQHIICTQRHVNDKSHIKIHTRKQITTVK